MTNVMLRLESFREGLWKRMLPIVGNNDYHLIGTVLALVFASGTLGTAFVATPVTLPAGGASFVVFLVTGVLAILTIVLFPLGLILL
jgi:hypothetical protein